MIGVIAFYSLLYILEFGHRLLIWVKVIDRTDISTDSLLSLFANTNLLVLLSTIKIKAHILVNKLISEIPDSFSSVPQACPTLCDLMDCSTPGLPVHCQLPEFT